MDFRKIKKTGGRLGAAAGIVGALAGLGGDPVVKNSSNGLSKTYAQYSKDVRLPETERDIARTLRRAGREKSARDKNGYELTAKDLKKLR